MVRATLEMHVKDGRGDEFEEAWRRVAAEVRRAPGNLGQGLLRDPNDPNSLVVTSDWESRDPSTQFERSREQYDRTAPLCELRESWRMSLHELLTHIERE